MFDYARMTAPFDGVVTQIYAYTGALLPAGTSSNKSDSGLCRLSQNNLLRLVIPVPERAVSDIHLGQNVAVNVSGIEQDVSTGKLSASPIKSIRPRGPCTPKWMFPIRNTSSSPECMPP